mmetsp:Transcript_6331/g.14118  ORF Transcript_6331/g.14118 Transcript_6331/m.14118 type:complete len:362 (+) Transcript_6331:44-1129(+)
MNTRADPNEQQMKTILIDLPEGKAIRGGGKNGRGKGGSSSHNNNNHSSSGASVNACYKKEGRDASDDTITTAPSTTLREEEFEDEATLGNATSSSSSNNNKRSAMKSALHHPKQPLQLQPLHEQSSTTATASSQSQQQQNSKQKPQQRPRQSNNNNNNNNYANANLQVNCNSCVSECSSMLQNYYEGNDETAYLGCNAAYADENGLQYYSMASCGEDGGLRIGLFYDDECTVKKDDVTGYGENFAYDTFLATQNICMSCADGICDDMEQSLECLDGKNQNYNVDDEMYACKAYKKAAKEWTYAKARGDKKVGLIVLSLLLIGLFLMGAYTYFVRHKRQEEKDKAATMAAAEPKAAEYAVMT